MMPLKTGAIIRLISHQNDYKVDAYKLVGYGWLFRICNQPIKADVEPHLLVGGCDDWFDEGNMHGTMIVPDHMVRMTPKFVAFLAEVDDDSVASLKAEA